MKPPFHEDYANPDVDPSGHGVEEFPFEEVFERLDGPQQPDGADRLADAMRALLHWASDVHLGHRSASRIIAARTVAMLWVIAPAEFGGRSLRRIAKDSSLDLNHLKRASAAFSRQFGIRNHGQSHAWNYKPRQGAEDPGPLSEHSPANKTPRRPRAASRRAGAKGAHSPAKADGAPDTRQNVPKESFAGRGLRGGQPSSRRPSSAGQNPPVP